MTSAFGRFALVLLLVGFVIFFIFYAMSLTDSGNRLAKTDVVTERSVIGGPSSGKPYSPAILTTRYTLGENGDRHIISRTLYVSGQIAIDPDTGAEVRDDVAAETRQVLENIRRRVEEADFEMADGVKCTVFLADIADYAAMNEVYVEFFPENPPARECVAVKEIVRGYRVEISLTAEK